MVSGVDGHLLRIVAGVDGHTDRSTPQILLWVRLARSVSGVDGRLLKIVAGLDELLLSPVAGVDVHFWIADCHQQRSTELNIDSKQSLRALTLMMDDPGEE